LKLLEPDPEAHSNGGSGSGSRRGKLSYRKRKYKILGFEVLEGFFLRTEGFSCSGGDLYGDLRISKWQF
jgi:hypothetical protein